jgi:quercetin dioxygenase-like cupin family protein
MSDRRMIVRRPDDVEPFVPDGPVFDGDIKAFQLFTEEETTWRRASLVRFEDGATTTPHVHEFDQLLLVVSGEGRVTSEGEEYVVRPGDMIFTPAGVPHTHGANGEHGSMSHFVVMGAGETRAV